MAQATPIALFRDSTPLKGIIFIVPNAIREIEPMQYKRPLTNIGNLPEITSGCRWRQPQ